MQSQTETRILNNPKLPEEFVNFVNEKLDNHKRGRKHIVQQLGSLDKTLELLRDYWLVKLNPKQLTKKYNVGYYQIYRFTQEVEKWKEQIIAYINYLEEVEPKDFREISIIKEWEAKIRRSGKLSMLCHIANFENICKGVHCSFKCHPNKFDLEKAQEFVDAYLKEHPNKKKLPRHLRQAIRHFLMVAKGINIPRGFGSAYGLSGEKDNFGIYRFVRATEDQIEAIENILEQKNDLEALVFFAWGIESLARATTIAKTKLDFQQYNGVVTTAMHEAKTDRLFPKYLLMNIPHCKKTWELIQRFAKLKNRHKYLFFDDDEEVTNRKAKRLCDTISPRLKEAYKQVGITDEYAYKKPFHFLRHTGAHLWLMRTKYDYGLVSEMGWEDINTLRQVYGGMPTEILTEKITLLSHQ